MGSYFKLATEIGTIVDPVTFQPRLHGTVIFDIPIEVVRDLEAQFAKAELSSDTQFLEDLGRDFLRAMAARHK